MYFTPGLNPNELGDFEMVAHKGRLHCFYLSLPSHDAIGHLESDDGINWRPLPVAVRTGEPGEFDGDQIWTMGVCRKGDTWFMLYTANQRRGLYQMTGLATSKDLVRWRKHPSNPVMRPDPRWYEAEQKGRYRVDWRDPHMVLHGGRLHGFLCGRRNQGLLNRRGCAVYFVSEDGLRWRVGPPACTPSNCFDFECPSVFEIGGRFYMTAIAGGPGRQVYAVADRVEGPYRRPWDDTMMPGRNMSVRPCFWRGETHLFHWQRGPADWTHSIDGYCILASPKVARVEPDVTLRVESFDWSGQYRGRPVRVGPRTPCAPSCGRWTWRGDGLNTSAQDGPAIWLTRKEHEDYEVAAELTLDPRNPAREFGLVFRADETGDRGLFASCVPGRYRAELVKYVYTRRRGPDSLWRGRSVEQEFHLPPAADGRYVLRAVVFGPSIEVNVNGRLTLAHCSMPQRRGRVGLFLEDGGATFRNVSIQPLRPPTCDFQF